MFFTATEYMNFTNRQRAANYQPPITLEQARLFMREIKQRVIARSFDPHPSSMNGSHWVRPVLTLNTYLGKWLRPWNVVPALATFTPPRGDASIGVEVEMGFRSLAAAQNVVRKIANWKHIAIDAEGGTNGVETTFPPILYSKLSKRSQVVRYLNLLEEEHRAGNVTNHNTMVGTHINVGLPGGFNQSSLDRINSILRYELSDGQKRKYFNRAPYGYGYQRGSGRYIEWKLFNSVPHSRDIFRYIDEAVELTRLAQRSSTNITLPNVVEALERGYNLRTAQAAR